ncbi:glycosyl hydrolase [Neurospora tetraspora]|uniref:Glycosyl hydrolase n=1 Tax=Neurospora tetraspora TaxID=94610 RepID=A0AAE0J6Z6_9PEZI|nr:glycosyl hydrolase [Neurospora tetraspora]
MRASAYFSWAFLLSPIWAAPVSEPTNPCLTRQTSTSFTDYAYVYFTGEGYSNGEQVYMAVSNNNDPNQWTTLKNGQPYLTTNVGTKGIRDPSLIVAPDRSKFWIIATDLKVNGLPGGWSNTDMQTKGSKSIVVWESTNLRNWSGPRLAKVSPDNAGMTWAPDAIWDPARNAFMVYWTSSVLSTGNGITAGWKTLRCYTNDFVTFTKPEEYLVGYGMDNTITAGDNGVFYMISKNGPNGLIQENVATNGLSGGWKKVSENIGQGSLPSGEGPLIFRDNKDRNKWHLWIDNNTKGTGYMPFETYNIAGGQYTKTQNSKLPANPRHGYVIPITAAERSALLSS